MRVSFKIKVICTVVKVRMIKTLVLRGKDILNKDILMVKIHGLVIDIISSANLPLQLATFQG